MKKRYFVIAVALLTMFLLCACKTEVEDKDYTLEYNDQTYEGKYTGTFESGKPVESGKFVCGEKGDDKYLIYEGTWEEGEMKGEGSLSTNNYVMHVPESEDEEAFDRTGTFEGSVIDGIANGQGTFEAETDDGEAYLYEGEWSDGVWNGIGKQTYDNEGLFNRIGHFEKGAYVPTTAELFKSLGTAKGLCPYELSDETMKFIDDNAECFTKHKGKAITENTKSDFSVNVFKKNPEKFKPAFVNIDNVQITQAQEYDVFGHEYTFAIAVDSDYDNYYYFHYLGSSKKIVEDKWVDVTILPLGYSTFENTAGSDTWAVSAAIVKIK